MHDLSENLQSALKSNISHLAHGWIITMTDGTVFAFTDHDDDVQCGGYFFLTAPGLQMPEFDHKLGLNVDSLDVLGVLESEVLTASMIRSGQLHDGVVRLVAFDWTLKDDLIPLFTGRIGTVVEKDGQFEVEIRQRTDDLEPVKGRRFGQMCDAKLGGHRCGVNLEGPAFHGFGQVVQMIDVMTLEVRGLEAFEQGWFSMGKLVPQSGDFKNITLHIAHHIKTQTGVRLNLWQPLLSPISADTHIKVIAGCDRAFSTCGSKFANQINFQGFPHIPGQSYATS